MKKFALKGVRKDVWYHCINEKRLKKIQNNTNEEIILEKIVGENIFSIAAKMKKKAEENLKTTNEEIVRTKSATNTPHITA